MKDNYAKTCESKVIKTGEGYIILDKTCFYPEGGGQPTDTGIIVYEREGQQKEVRVTRVSKEKGIIKHYTSEPIAEGCGVKCMLDWDKRYKYMMMHTAEHVLSAIMLDKFDAEVAGNQIKFETSRIDYKPFKPTEENLKMITEEFNKIIDAEIPVVIEQTTREDMMQRVDEKRRRLFERLPSFIKEVRLVVIKDFDMQPCAGSHIANTKEILIRSSTD